MTKQRGADLSALGQALVQAAPPPPPTLTAAVMAAITAAAPHEALAAARLRSGRPLPRARWQASRWWRRGLALLALLVPVGMGIGAARASDGALPGESLYGVRLAHEALLLTLAPDRTARDRVVLTLAQQRVRDLQRAIHHHAGAPVTREVLRMLLAYNRQVSVAHAPWLRTALLRQYVALQGERRQVERDAVTRSGTDEMFTERALDSSLGQLRALARTVGASWAQGTPDTPGPAPATD